MAGSFAIANADDKWIVNLDFNNTKGQEVVCDCEEDARIVADSGELMDRYFKNQSAQPERVNRCIAILNKYSVNTGLFLRKFNDLIERHNKKSIWEK